MGSADSAEADSEAAAPLEAGEIRPTNLSLFCLLGLFSVADRPYRPLIAGMAKTNSPIYDVWLGGEKPFVFDHPLFSPKR